MILFAKRQSNVECEQLFINRQFEKLLARLGRIRLSLELTNALKGSCSVETPMLFMSEPLGLRIK